MEPQEKLSSYVILRPPTIPKIVWNLLGNDTAGGALLDLLRQTKHSHSSALALNSQSAIRTCFDCFQDNEFAQSPYWFILFDSSFPGLHVLLTTAKNVTKIVWLYKYFSSKLLDPKNLTTFNERNSYVHSRIQSKTKHEIKRSKEVKTCWDLAQTDVLSEPATVALRACVVPIFRLALP